jgi:shikimate 5-dehydrogenase
MLIWQGALAFEIWTGRQAPINIMRKDAQRFLKSHEK